MRKVPPGDMASGLPWLGHGAGGMEALGHGPGDFPHWEPEEGSPAGPARRGTDLATHPHDMPMGEGSGAPPRHGHDRPERPAPGLEQACPPGHHHGHHHDEGQSLPHDFPAPELAHGPAPDQAILGPQGTAIDPGVNLGTVPGGSIGIAYGDTFRLHSLPTSSLKVFLDFDGHVTTGTSWNAYFNSSSIASPAFSLDGSSTFNAEELLRIQQIWQRVAEYFSPFNIDVTTEDPGVAGLTYTGSGDTAFGIRVVITDEGGKSFGGLGYNGSFDWNSDTPVFVYANPLGDNTKYISDAAAHEVGHSLGLSHDGQGGSEYYYGHGGWAPVMGVGYDASIVQWSNGGYAGATTTEDDLTIITTTNSGVGYRADDVGNTFATAAALGGTIGATGIATVQRFGVISGSGARNDIDMYSFGVAQGGALDLSVSGWSRAWVSGSATPSFAPSPFSMLDVALTLYNASFSVVASFNSSTRQDGTISLSGLSGGTYYLAIDGTGWGSPLAATPSGYSEYGSLGQYMVTGTYTAVLAGDTTPPAAPLIAGITDDLAPLTGNLARGAATNDTTLTLAGTAEANSTVTLRDGGTLLGTVRADAGGAWSFTTAPLAEGPRSFTATATDAAGNASAASAAFAVTIDTTAPGAPAILSFTPPTGGPALLSGSAEAGSLVQLFDFATLLGSATADELGGWSISTSALPATGYRIAATATDAAGNVSGFSAPVLPVAPLALALDRASLSTTEGGRADSVVVRALNAGPGTGEIVVAVSGLDATEGSLSASTLVLNAANGWAARLTVTGRDDREDDGAQSYALGFSAAGLDPVSVLVGNADNDIVPVGIGASVLLSGRQTVAVPGASAGSLGATDAAVLVLREGGAAPGFLMAWNWSFTGLTAGNYRLQVDATSSGEAFRLLTSVDGGGSWQVVRAGSKPAAFSADWDGSYFVSGVGESLLVRVVDQDRKADAVQDSVMVDLLTLAPVGADLVLG